MPATPLHRSTAVLRAVCGPLPTRYLRVAVSLSATSCGSSSTSTCWLLVRPRLPLSGVKAGGIAIGPRAPLFSYHFYLLLGLAIAIIIDITPQELCCTLDDFDVTATRLAFANPDIVCASKEVRGKTEFQRLAASALRNGNGRGHLVRTPCFHSVS